MFALRHRKTALKALAFSPDGRMIAAAEGRGHVVVWDLASREPVVDTWASFYLGFVVFRTPKIIWAATVGDIRELDLDAPEKLVEVPLLDKGGIYPRAAVASDLSLAFVACGKSVQAMPLPPAPPAWTWGFDGYGRCKAMAITVDGRTLAVGTTDGTYLLDAATGKETGELGHADRKMTSLAVAPDGQAVAWTAASRLRVARKGQPVIERTMGRTHFLGVAWHPSGGFFATANGDGRIDCWDAATAERRESFDWKAGKLNALAFEPAGDRAACCSETGQVVVWDVER